MPDALTNEALRLLRHQLNGAAVLYVDQYEARRIDMPMTGVELWHAAQADLRPRDRSRWMVRAFAGARSGGHDSLARKRASSKRMRCPNTIVCERWPYVLDRDTRGPRMGIKMGTTTREVPRGLTRETIGIAADTRLWLRSLADVVYVASFPWTLEWAESPLFAALVGEAADRDVELDRMQASGGKPGQLAEAIAVWLRRMGPHTKVHKPRRLRAAIDVFRAAAALHGS